MVLLLRLAWNLCVLFQYNLVDRHSPLQSLSFHQLFSYHCRPPIVQVHLALAAGFHQFFPMYRLLGHLRVGRPDNLVLRLAAFGSFAVARQKRKRLKGLPCGTPFRFMQRLSSHLSFALKSAKKDLNNLRALGCSPYSVRSLRRRPLQILSKAAFRSSAAMMVHFFWRLIVAFCTIFACTSSVMRPGWKPDCSGRIMPVSAAHLFNLFVTSASRVLRTQCRLAYGPLQYFRQLSSYRGAFCFHTQE